jgi:dimethylargininase
VTRTAIVRPPASTFAQGLTRGSLGAPDLDRALAQHLAYVRALERLGFRVIALEPDADHPDSTFVEDTAVLLPDGVVYARPGAPSRRGEVERMRRALSASLAERGAITAPGTLDGGDVCEAGEEFLIGISERTNEDGAAGLESCLAAAGLGARRVALPAGGDLLHLKSGLSWLGGRRFLAVEALIGHPALAGLDLVLVDAEEALGANAVRVDDSVLMPAGCPRLERRLAGFGLAPVPLELSEFQKMDGGVSCLSLRVGALRRGDDA